MIVFIVISFLEIILPKGKMKRFVNFIIGLLVIFVIISPFIKLDQLELHINRQTEELMNIRENEILLNDQEDKVRDIFLERLENEITNLVKNNSSYEVISINIHTNEEVDEIMIAQVSLTVKEQDENIGGDIIIDEIKIDNYEDRAIENDHSDIESLIADHLGIDENIINIGEVY